MSKEFPNYFLAQSPTFGGVDLQIVQAANAIRISLANYGDHKDSIPNCELIINLDIKGNPTSLVSKNDPDKILPTLMADLGVQQIADYRALGYGDPKKISRILEPIPMIQALAAEKHRIMADL